MGGHKQYFLGFNTDHIATMLALLGSVFVLLKFHTLKGILSSVVFLYFLYLVFAVFSIFYGGPNQVAFYSLFSGIVYFVISISISIFFINYDAGKIFDHSIFFGFVSSFVIVVSFFLLGNSSWGRMTIPVFYNGGFHYFPFGYESSSDPNVLSYFLGFSLLIMLWKRNNSIFGSYWVFFFFIVFSAFLLAGSRSGSLAFFMSVFLYISLSVMINKKTKRISFYNHVFFISLVYILGFFVLRHYGVLDVLISRALDFSSTSNTDRIYRLANSIDLISSSASSLFFGYGLGYSRDTIDPHNFFLSTILDTGIFSIFILFYIIFYILLNAFKVRGESSVHVFMSTLVFYFIIISLFYWQVRTYYFLMALLLVSFFSLKNKKDTNELVK